jgi:hypothetical protein
MNKALLAFLLLSPFAFSAPTAARVQLMTPSVEKDTAARQALYNRLVHDHPLAEAMPNSRVAVRIMTDRIMRSCCMPPELVIAGKVTNRTAHPLDYVRLRIAFENAIGGNIYAETIYNSKAASMADSPEVERMLNEKPHFTPLAPGTSDTFVFSIPLPLLPKFAKVRVYADGARR